MKCQFCQKEIADGTRFCRYCGREQQNMSASGGHCPNCGAVNPPGAAFCAKCGSRVSQSYGHQQQQNPSAAVGKVGKRNKKGSGKGTGWKIFLILLIALVVIAAAVFVFRMFTGGGSEGKMKKNVFAKYFEYMGMKFDELPDSFEIDTLAETDTCILKIAETEEEYAKIDGVVHFIGYEPVDGVTWEEVDETFTIRPPRKIASFSWVPDEFDEDIEDQILDQLIKDYGEYDGKEKHTMRHSDDEEYLKYTFYYWSNRGDDQYDIEFVMMEPINDAVSVATPNWVSFSQCEGESDSEYMKPLELLEQAVKEGDAEAFAEAFSEWFLEENGMDEREIEESLEHMEKISFDVQKVEKLQKSYQTAILMEELEVDPSALADVTDTYVIEAEMETETDGEKETVEAQIVVGKQDGEWKIFYLDEP